MRTLTKSEQKRITGAVLRHSANSQTSMPITIDSTALDNIVKLSRDMRGHN